MEAGGLSLLSFRFNPAAHRNVPTNHLPDPLPTPLPTHLPTNYPHHRLLNRAKTPMGKRLLLRWLHQPLLDLPALTRRLDVVEALSADPELRELLRGTHLRTVSDVERLTLKLERRKATLVDLCKLYQARGAG